MTDNKPWDETKYEEKGTFYECLRDNGWKNQIFYFSNHAGTYEVVGIESDGQGDVRYADVKLMKVSSPKAGYNAWNNLLNLLNGVWLVPKKESRFESTKRETESALEGYPRSKR